MQDTVLNLIATAYHSGLLQYHPLNVFGITVTMKMHGSFNTVTMQDDRSGKTSYIQVYDNDSQDLQEYSINMVLSEMFQ